MLLSYIERLRLVGMIGFIVDLAALGQKPVLTESFGTIVTGAMAVVLHLLVSRLTIHGIHQLSGWLENSSVGAAAEMGVRQAFQ